MASTSSRDAALERRKALTNGGKKAEGRFSSAPIRVRTAVDARPSRTEVVVTAPAPTPVSPASARQPSTPLSAPPTSVNRRTTRAISNPSRDLVLARREALSQRGKRASTSRDRTRTDVAKTSPSPAEVAPRTKGPCKCQETPESQQRTAPSEAPSLSLGGGTRSGLGNGGASRANGERRSSSKRASQYNPSRALVLARREALAKRGKSASSSTSSTAASVARQVNPDLTSRELAQKVRELKCKVGSAGSARSGGSRPSGPNRNGAKEAALATAADAHWKVGLTQTSQGQIVTGTQANRSAMTTGNEAGTCRVVTGTEYLGSEVFNSFCQTGPLGTQPAKVAVTSTSHGNRVTGNEIGRSEKVTGDEPGTCKMVTGTEYLSANQSQAYCGINAATPRKVGRTATLAGQPVSGVMVGRSEKVTGDEPGSGRHLTGDQYVTEQFEVPGRAPQKVGAFQTLRGTGITGTTVGRSGRVTGDEPGSCRNVTGDEYIGSEQYEGFCGVRPAPEAPKVGFSVTPRSQVVSGTRTGRSEKVTGDEPGTCKIVTGTPYAGLEEAGNWCSTNDVQAIRQRTPVRMGTVMSGIQPGIGGVMTGAGRGACEDISGTPYVGPDQLSAACGIGAAAPVDFPQPLTTPPWQEFSVQSPARVAQVERETTGAVTGSTYEHGGRITGPFDMAAGKVTGTEQFRFDRRQRDQARGPLTPVAPAVESPPGESKGGERPTSRITGEGLSGGLNITGDDWNRGKHVTGTEGPSARRRNPSRSGSSSAMPAFQAKRNEALPEPVSKITGSSGNTLAGSLITVSGGARG